LVLRSFVRYPILTRASDGQMDRSQVKKPRISLRKPVRWPYTGLGHVRPHANYPGEFPEFATDRLTVS
jgi:hypothetical protein